MSDNPTSPDRKPLPAGDFSSWLRQARTSLLGAGEMDVACGGCVGCCSSAYFIHVKPGERAVGRIPGEVLFPAPGLPKGHMLMGYDQDGWCPMLKDGKCGIYADRPHTCRSYDCRVFAAAGISAGGDEKSIINRRVEQWAFSYPTETDRDEHRAVKVAASFIREHPDCFPGGRVPGDPSQLAVLAIKAYSVFLERSSDAATTTELAVAVVDACRKFGEPID